MVTEVVKSNKDDWKYRRCMWWLNFRRKIIYDKIRSKKPCKSVKDDWEYRRNMWWLNFRRKIIYDKMRSKKPCKMFRKNLKVYEGGIHKFIDEFKNVKGCDIRGWKKRFTITKSDVRSYVNKSKSNCKVKS